MGVCAHVFTVFGWLMAACLYVGSLAPTAAAPQQWPVGVAGSALMTGEHFEIPGSSCGGWHLMLASEAERKGFDQPAPRAWQNVSGLTGLLSCGTEHVVKQARDAMRFNHVSDGLQ